MPGSTALATITPSGNRIVEVVTQAICAPLADLSAHFSRIPVHGSAFGNAPYDWERMVEAAELLSHAKPDVICWNGTKGGALGFEVDRELCQRITIATGLPATTAALSTLDALSLMKARTIALVTPYDTAYQAQCMAAFEAQGYVCVCEAHAGLTDNFSYCNITENEIVAMTEQALADAKPDAVVYFCTNFRGAPIAARLEAALGVTVLDSTALGVWGAMRAAGYDTSHVKGWGRLFGLH